MPPPRAITKPSKRTITATTTTTRISHYTSRSASLYFTLFSRVATPHGCIARKFHLRALYLAVCAFDSLSPPFGNVGEAGALSLYFTSAHVGEEVSAAGVRPAWRRAGEEQRRPSVFLGRARARRGAADNEPVMIITQSRSFSRNSLKKPFRRSCSCFRAAGGAAQEKTNPLKKARSCRVWCWLEAGVAAKAFKAERAHLLIASFVSTACQEECH